jgi:hypothetical protein
VSIGAQEITVNGVQYRYSPKWGKITVGPTWKTHFKGNAGAVETEWMRLKSKCVEGPLGGRDVDDAEPEDDVAQVRGDLAPAVRQGREVAESVQHIRQLHGEIMEHMRQFAEKVVVCGFELLALKRQVGHGRWGKFCESNLYAEGFSERHTRRYMEVATAIRQKMRGLEDQSGMAALDAGVLDMDTVREALADTTNATSWRQLWMDLGLMRNPKPRGGDHGGGQARAEKLKQQAAELDFSLANEQWQRIILDLSDFTTMARYAHVHPATLQAGVARIKDCLSRITKEG